MPLAPAHVELDPDQSALVQTVHDFAVSQLLPLDRRCDEDESSVTQALPALADMGLLSLIVPDNLGGLGCPFSTYTAIIHEIAASSPSVAVTIAVHSLVGSILKHEASDAIRRARLGEWGLPESLSAFALSEAGAGSDAANVTTSASKVKGGYRINGEKMWVTNGLTARWLLALVRLGGARDDGSLCAMLIDGNTDGISRTPIHGKMGIRGSETAVVSFTDAFVAEEQLIGEVGDGLDVMLSGLNHGRVGIAAQATGIAEACLNEMLLYARQREQFGRRIGSFQGVANMIADSAVELEAAKALTWRAAGRIQRGELDRDASSMAKLFATEAANRIAYRAVQVHGGTGYVRECRVEQLYRDARITTIYEGTSEIQRLVVARGLGRLPHGA